MQQQEELLRHQISAETAQQAEKILVKLTEQIRIAAAKPELRPADIETEFAAADDEEQPLQMPDAEENEIDSSEIMKELMKQMI